MASNRNMVILLLGMGSVGAFAYFGAQAQDNPWPPPPVKPPEKSMPSYLSTRTTPAKKKPSNKLIDTIEVPKEVPLIAAPPAIPGQAGKSGIVQTQVLDGNVPLPPLTPGVEQPQTKPTAGEGSEPIMPIPPLPSVPDEAVVLPGAPTNIPPPSNFPPSGSPKALLPSATQPSVPPATVPNASTNAPPIVPPPAFPTTNATEPGLNLPAIPGVPTSEPDNSPPDAKSPGLPGLPGLPASAALPPVEPVPAVVVPAAPSFPDLPMIEATPSASVETSNKLPALPQVPAQVPAGNVELPRVQAPKISTSNAPNPLVTPPASSPGVPKVNFPVEPPASIPLPSTQFVRPNQQGGLPVVPPAATPPAGVIPPVTSPSPAGLNDFNQVPAAPLVGKRPPVPATPASEKKIGKFVLVHPLPTTHVGSGRKGVAGSTASQTNSSDPASLNTKGIPQVTVKKIGPTSVKLGQPIEYTIVVHNHGKVPAIDVRVVDEIPVQLRFLKADPRPAMQQDRAIWTFPVLPPGVKRTLRVHYEARAEGEIASTTTLNAGVTAIARTRVASTAVSVLLEGPERAGVGQPVVFEATVLNNTSQPMSGLVLRVHLPEGLKHPIGSSIEGDVGPLPPGGSKQVRITTTGTQSGQHAVEAKVTQGEGGEVASARATVMVGEGGLQIQQDTGGRLFLDRSNQIRLNIINHNKETMRNVVVSNHLPEDVEFLGASDRGLFRPDNGRLHWLVDRLEPGQIKTLVYEVKPKRPGTMRADVTAKAEQGAESQSTALYQIEGRAELDVRVVGRDPQVKLGKDTIYQVRVVNRGNVPARNTKVRVHLPRAMNPGHALGPTSFRKDGDDVVFAPLPVLAPGATAVFNVGATAQSTGEITVRIEVLCDQQSAPVVREERTLVFNEQR